jgi:ubiquinone/menaquinone biosynthesis C-methylase UbiE
MSIETIQRSYNDVVADHYDLDPQGVTGNSQDRAVKQLQDQFLFGEAGDPFRVLDLGMGTGLFLAKLKALGGEQIIPFGLDLAPNMLENARRKLPDLIAEVDDAANLDAHFPGQMFDCVSTHFVTGFVPMSVLAPKIWDRLEEGGYWSLVGGTKAAYPTLQRKANSWFVRRLCGLGKAKIDDLIQNPADTADACKTLEANGFEVCAAESFEPALAFKNFDEFMEYAYTGGWLTPIIESIGLQKSGDFTRWVLNNFLFPFNDNHSIAIVLARKVVK